MLCNLSHPEAQLVSKAYKPRLIDEITKLQYKSFDRPIYLDPSPFPRSIYQEGVRAEWYKFSEVELRWLQVGCLVRGLAHMVIL